jgi:hypothetical protein
MRSEGPSRLRIGTKAVFAALPNATPEVPEGQKHHASVTELFAHAVVNFALG